MTYLLGIFAFCLIIYIIILQYKISNNENIVNYAKQINEHNEKIIESYEKERKASNDYIESLKIGYEKQKELITAIEKSRSYYEEMARIGDTLLQHISNDYINNNLAYMDGEYFISQYYINYLETLAKFRKENSNDTETN